MLYLSSPAKTLDYESKINYSSATYPKYLRQAAQLVNALRKFSRPKLAKLLDVSDELAAINYERFKSWKESHTKSNSRPAVYAYRGSVYQQLGLSEYTEEQMNKLQSEMRIISGLYGLLRPLDLIQPYRLEMNANLELPPVKNLYEYWGETLTQALIDEIRKDGHKLLINLASEEYSAAVDFEKLPCPVVHVAFRQKRAGRLNNIGLIAKRSRGQLIDFIARKGVTEEDGLAKFNLSGYKKAPGFMILGKNQKQIMFVSTQL